MYLSTTIPIKIYDTKVQFIITKDITKIFNRINCYHKTGVSWKKNESAAGCTILCSMAKYYILINQDYLSYNTICHEIYHCTHNLAIDRGIHEEESQAWIQGIIAQEIFNFLRKKNLEIA